MNSTTKTIKTKKTKLFFSNRMSFNKLELITIVFLTSNLQ